MHSKEHDPIELYDLNQDIGETNNLADKNPEIIDQVEQMFANSHLPSEHFTWKYLDKKKGKSDYQ